MHKHISNRFVCVAYKNMSFNNGFNIFYSITLLTVLFITSAALLLWKWIETSALNFVFFIYIRYFCVSTLMAHLSSISKL